MIPLSQMRAGPVTGFEGVAGFPRSMSLLWIGLCAGILFAGILPLDRGRFGYELGAPHALMSLAERIMQDSCGMHAESLAGRPGVSSVLNWCV